MSDKDRYQRMSATETKKVIEAVQAGRITFPSHISGEGWPEDWEQCDFQTRPYSKVGQRHRGRIVGDKWICWDCLATMPIKRKP